MTDSRQMKKALLVVSFGTTYVDTRERTIGATTRALSAAFPDSEVRSAFTSRIVARILRKRDGLVVDSVEESLQRLVHDGFSDVIVQSLHLLKGVEFEKMKRAADKFSDKFKHLSIGMPLLDSEADLKNVAKAMQSILPSVAADEAILLMGHGSDHEANEAYFALQREMNAIGMSNVYLGTVEGRPRLENILPILKQKLIRRVHLAPFMFVAGDHAQNDMAGDDEDSWKSILTEEDFEVEVDLHGLGEHKQIQALFLEHAHRADKKTQMGKLIGVGLGPGDPELLTMKAVRLIQSANVVAYPVDRAGCSFARQIVDAYLDKARQQEIPILFEMIRDPVQRQECRVISAMTILSHLREGHDVVFLTEGDPLIYSTFQHIIPLLPDNIKIEVCPGISAYQAASAASVFPLVIDNETLVLSSADGALPKLSSWLDEGRCVVLYKVAKRIPEIKSVLRAMRKRISATLIERCSLDDETIVKCMDDWKEEELSYFSIILIKPKSEEL